jgi:hypothetical protein
MAMMEFIADWMDVAWVAVMLWLVGGPTKAEIGDGVQIENSMVSSPPQPIEPTLRYPSIADSHFNRAMAQPLLNCPQINSLVG